MQAKTRFIIVVALAAALGVRVNAQAPSGQTPAAPTTGKVLLLENERALEGDSIELQGDQYCIRRGQSEMRMSAAGVIRLCASWDDALAFIKSRTNLFDAEERLRLAHWCHHHGLFEQGLAEVTVALDLRPTYPEAKQLQQFLARGIAARSAPSSKAQTEAALPPPPAVDLSTESLAQFTSKVQPILMNTCARCHTHGQGGRFQLFRYDGGQRTTLQRNLASALAQVNLEKPHLSPLLIKAVSTHWQDMPGSNHAPLAGRQTVPFRTLETWVQAIAASNPHLLEEYRRAAVTQVEPRALPRQVTESVPLPLPPHNAAPSRKEPGEAVRAFHESWLRGNSAPATLSKPLAPKAGGFAQGGFAQGAPTKPAVPLIQEYQPLRPLPEGPKAPVATPDIQQAPATMDFPRPPATQTPLTPATALPHDPAMAARAVEHVSSSNPHFGTMITPPEPPRPVPITSSTAPASPPQPPVQPSTPPVRSPHGPQPPTSDDPYDAEAFNRVMHPSRPQ